VGGQLLLEAHPPVDAQGQTAEPELAEFEKLLDRVLGSSTAAIHWDFARETLQAANGIPTVVGLEADSDTSPQQAAPTPASSTVTSGAVPEPEHDPMSGVVATGDR
jgi:hypothetical protein